ncbi:hypothetical protein GCM10020255_045790 [Rhodococcus baikonurensis]
MGEGNLDRLPVLHSAAHLARLPDRSQRRNGTAVLEAAQQVKNAQDSYIREVAGKSPAESIADAKALLDAGTISEEEFAALKAKALA